MKKYFIGIFAILFLSVPGLAYAHCPLCTAGAGALAVFAASIGVNTATIGVFIGAFSVAIGLWVARIIKREYIPGQKWLITIASFILTVWPLTPLLTNQYGSYYVSWFGEYGSLFNRTYVWNWFLVSAVIGALLMIVSPWVSSQLTKLRGGRRFPYQGMVIVFVLLIIVGLVFQFTLW